MYARPGSKLEQSEDIQLEELYSKLKRYCRFLSQNDWDSEDLAHEAFRKALEHYELNVNITPALLKKIAHNLWLDQLKKRSREVLGAIPESIIEQHECSKDIKEYLAKLTSKQSVIFTLKESFKYQISEIAEIFQMSETAVKAILHRAKKRLKTISSDENLPLLQEYAINDYG
ncbi:sigma-70 family RNA polymerase sigma factor [Pseudalkalibacillus berkeleyi]|uniref:Sigma-70 family RNA polymerase sigma factor n=1 Tax=Pseudalkalibacillus berkeleyi TaxID=1069813 RepID=A0ABS9GXJ9_9BACL|nr:sigma-70 family RNA polymerase sigma factor [Pseudalkalibacillus berkeleyi]MCF6136410.1 sigma-70 family RNA polymerase sigma factor [Pseudalkalibacillus berkeleyi]